MQVLGDQTDSSGQDTSMTLLGYRLAEGSGWLAVRYLRCLEKLRGAMRRKHGAYKKLLEIWSSNECSRLIRQRILGWPLLIKHCTASGWEMKS